MSVTNILFVRPADDSAAITVATWGYALFQMVPSACSAKDMSGSANVSRTIVDQELNTGVQHLFWFGHGSDTALISANAAMVDSANLQNLQSGMVVAIACYAGGSLGTAAGGMAGVKAFLGFDDELGFPSAFPARMGQAVVEGLRCLFLDNHDIACAANELRDAFDRARIDYKANGMAYGLNVDGTRLAWLFAKSNRHSVTLHGSDVGITIV